MTPNESENTMTLPKALLLVGSLAFLFSCAAEDVLSPARDLTGRWTGAAPNGAIYRDNVANPNCMYEANLVLDLVQTGGALSGTLQLTVRNVDGPLANPGLACVPVGTTSTQALTGEVGSTRSNFTLSDGITVFSGTYTSDIFSGDFVVNDVNGVIGTFTVVR